MTIYIYAILILFGLVMGSFAGATIWRIRARQLFQDKKQGIKVDSAEYKILAPLLKSKNRNDRSLCLACHHQLTWYDLLPLVSWLSTGGRCRYCKKPIGKFEPIMEISVAALFCVSYALWPYEFTSSIALIHFLVWLVGLVIVFMLFVYDLRWMILPLGLTIAYAVAGCIFVILGIIIGKDLSYGYFMSLIWSIILMSGLYYALYRLSNGRWVGGGDYKLGLGLGLFLGSWTHAFIGLFLANLIGCLIVIPAMMMKKLSRQSSVPLGPLLIVGSLLSFFYADVVLEMLGISFIL